MHYTPMPRKLVYAILELLKLSDKDVLWDLGCGDGRILIAAARIYGARAIGVEIRRWLTRIAIRNIRKFNLSDRVAIICGDFFRINLSSATAITLYLSTKVNNVLKKKFVSELKDGTRIISLDFEIPGWPYNSLFKLNDGFKVHNAYLYVFKRSKYK